MRMRWYVVAAMMLCICVGSVKLKKMVCTPHTYTIQYDIPLFSPALCTSIDAYVDKSIGNQVLALTPWTQSFLKQFPTVKTVTATILPTGIFFVEICPYIPRFIINNDYVLCAEGSLFLSTDFVSSSHKELPSVKIADPLQKQCTQKFYQTLAYINAQYGTDYTITWKSNTTIELHHKQYQNVVVLLAPDGMRNDSVKTAIQNVITNLVAHDKKRKMKGYTALDARFAGQLILYTIEGERA